MRARTSNDKVPIDLTQSIELSNDASKTAGWSACGCKPRKRAGLSSLAGFGRANYATLTVVLIAALGLVSVFLQQSLSLDSNTTAPEPRILMFSYVFGEKQVQKKLFRLFVESARGSGIDVALVGYPAPAFPLPPNVRHVSVTWDEFTDRVSRRLFNGAEPGDLRESQRAGSWNYYKCNDFKPLFAYLFPEEVKGYEWWGHLDNDLILGNVRSFLTDRLLSGSDVISPIPGYDNMFILGSFALFRNTPKMNELFKLAEGTLEEIFATRISHNFAEWGHASRGVSMSQIISRHRKHLGIRWTGNVPFVWDGSCWKGKPGICMVCEFSQSPSGHQTLRGLPRMFHLFGLSVRLAFCHFQWSKGRIEEYLKSEALLNEVLRERHFRYNNHEGFVHLNGTRFENQAVLSDW